MPLAVLKISHRDKGEWLIFRSIRLRNILILSTVLCLYLVVGAQGSVRAVGNKIFAPSGQEILLRGIGLGGWLVPEGYMLQTSAFANSPTEIRYTISSL